MKLRLALTLSWSLPLAAASVDFVRDVRPIFEKHCYSFHGPEKQKSGLRLDVTSEALRGDDTHAPGIVAGKAKESPLIQFVISKDEGEQMPPKGERLSATEIALLKRWVDEGAVWPDGIDAAKVVDKRDHWAFKPLASKGGPLDSFIEDKLAVQGLTLAPEADRRTLIRRLYLVLHGLPPTP